MYTILPPLRLYESMTKTTTTGERIQSLRGDGKFHVSYLCRNITLKALQYTEIMQNECMTVS